MAKQYPIFYKKNSKNINFVAVFSATESLEITSAKYTNGFIFNRYYSRAKVRQLEKYSGDTMDAEMFFKQAGEFMQKHLLEVKHEAIKALPELGLKLLT